MTTTSATLPSQTVTIDIDRIAGFTSSTPGYRPPPSGTDASGQRPLALGETFTNLVDRVQCVGTGGGAFTEYAMSLAAGVSTRPLAYYGVVGDGSASDFARMQVAIADSVQTGLPLAPRPGTAYSFGSQLQFPSGFKLKSQRSSPFVFHASDAFTSQDRPSAAGAANANCIYCLNADDLSLEGLKIVFDRGTTKNSWVNGLSVRGGKGVVVDLFEATGFNSGYIIIFESVTNFLIDRPYIHDCMQQNDGTTGASGVAARAAQTTGIQFDDNKLNDAQGNAKGSSFGVVSNFLISNLYADAATRNAVGWQTDGLNPPYGTNHVIFANGLVERVDEGIDISGGRDNTIANVLFRDITFYAMKVLYGATNNKFSNVKVDGVGASAIILSASGSPYSDSIGNDFTDISVRRVGVFGTGTFQSPGQYDTNIPQGVAPQAIQQPAVVTFDNSTGASTGVKNTNISLKSVRDCAPGTPLLNFTSASSAGDTGNKIDVQDMDASIATALLKSANYYQYAFGQRMAFDIRPRQNIVLPDANSALNVWERYAATGVMTAARTVALPPAASVPAGTTIVVADVAGVISASNILTVRTTSLTNGETINGFSSINVTAAYGKKSFTSDGSTKWLMA